jgi:glycosyltransferase involved in cell wall biosynthesis
LVVNEAFAAGIPAIVSQDIGCAETMIEPGRTGWVYDGTEPALAQILATAAIADTLSADAIAGVSNRHSLDAGTERMLEILDVVTRRIHSPPALSGVPA